MQDELIDNVFKVPCIRDLFSRREMIAYIIISIVFLIFACVAANANQKMNNQLTAANTKIKSLEESLVWLHLNEDDRKILGSDNVPALLKDSEKPKLKICKSHSWSAEHLGPIISKFVSSLEAVKGSGIGVIKICSKCPAQDVRGKINKSTGTYTWYLDELRKEW